MLARRLCLLLVAGGVLAGSGSAAFAAGIPVQQARIMDNTGFKQPMVAATIMVPQGMTTQGGVRWRTQLNDCPDGHTIDWQASSPDGTWAITIYPEERWGHSSMGQRVAKACHDSSIATAREFLEAWVGIYRKGARVLDYRDRLDLEQETAQLNQQQTIGSMRMVTRRDAGEVLIAYPLNGQDMREAVVVVVVVTETVFGGMGVGPDSKTVFGYNLPGFAMRAPAGQLNFANMEKLRRSIKISPEWNARINQHMQVMNRQNIEHAGKMSDINRKSASDINQIITKGYAERNAIRDRGQRETVEAIRGTETWNTPGGGTRELQDSRNAWQLDNGNFVTSDNPNWRPADSGLSGQQLQRAQ
ncbi:MAG: hypothetical protein ACRBC3_01375 [Burkholderiaceae bacterium]